MYNTCSTHTLRNTQPICFHLSVPACLFFTFDPSMLPPHQTPPFTYPWPAMTLQTHLQTRGVFAFRDLTPHPQYAAFYKWLQQDFQADAVVHFGMHGTVEWLPGAPLGDDQTPPPPGPPFSQNLQLLHTTHLKTCCLCMRPP